MHWCEWLLELPERDEIIARTGEVREDPESPYQLTLPMAVELGRALGVKWAWEEYE